MEKWRTNVAAQKYKIRITTLHEHSNKSKGTIRPDAGRSSFMPLEEEK